jgi:hypothetical protein
MMPMTPQRDASSHSTPVDSRDFATGVLSVTGVILLAALVLVETRPTTVQASGLTTTAGEFILTVGTDLAPDEELLYILDAPTERLIAYRFDPMRKEIQLVQGIELDKLRGAQPSPQLPPGKQRP